MARSKANVVLPLRPPFPNTPGESAEPPAVWNPNLDLYQTETGALVVVAELAGLRRGDLKLSIEAGQLCIRGVRRVETGDRVRNCLVSEICHGRFAARIEIPAGYDARRARATYRNGLLRIEVPPTARPAPRLRADPELIQR